MLQVMANTMLLATGRSGSPQTGPDFGRDRGSAHRPPARDLGYAPDADRADRLRRMRAAIESYAPAEPLRRA